VSLLSDPGALRRRRAKAETSRLSYRLSGEGVLVRVRTYVFPGVLRGRPGPRLATTLTNRPRRSLSSPRVFLLWIESSAAKTRDAVPSRSRTRLPPDRRAPRWAGGAASHLFGLALVFSPVPRLQKTLEEPPGEGKGWLVGLFAPCAENPVQPYRCEPNRSRLRMRIVPLPGRRAGR
jgi:hypothetical protein